MTAFPYLVPSMPEAAGEQPASQAEPRRLTLVARSAATANGATIASARVVAVDALAVLLRASIDGIVQLDVERVILDRSARPEEFLKLLSSLPAEFSGDILLITEDNGGYLSASGRGAGRVLYSLTADDVDFYLRSHDLAEESRLIGHSARE